MFVCSPVGLGRRVGRVAMRRLYSACVCWCGPLVLLEIAPHPLVPSRLLYLKREFPMEQ